VENNGFARRARLRALHGMRHHQEIRKRRMSLTLRNPLRGRRRMTSRRGMFAFSDWCLGTGGMAPARAIHVIRSVPSVMRGSQGVKGPLVSPGQSSGAGHERANTTIQSAATTDKSGEVWPGTAACPPALWGWSRGAAGDTV
jgi:hypothetical protein